MDIGDPGQQAVSEPAAAVPAHDLMSWGGLAEVDPRIALTSTVIQRLSRAGLLLASAASLTQGQAAERIQRGLDELDALIRDIRASAFSSLVSTPAPGPRST